jgi:hypothetical protein
MPEAKLLVAEAFQRYKYSMQPACQKLAMLLVLCLTPHISGVRAIDPDLVWTDI